MDHNDYPHTPFTLSEQHRIMADVEQAKRVAVEEHDEARTFYLNQIDTHND